MGNAFGKKSYDEPVQSDVMEDENTGPDFLLLGTIFLALVAGGLFAIQIYSGHVGGQSQNPLQNPLQSAQMTASQVTENGGVSSLSQRADAHSELTSYLNPALDFSWKTKRAKYERTASLLDDCGKNFKHQKQTYLERNQTAYENLKSQSAQSMNANSQAVDELSGLRVSMSIRQDNSKLNSMNQGREVMMVEQEQKFRRDLSKSECEYIAQRVEQGLQDI